MNSMPRTASNISFRFLAVAILFLAIPSAVEAVCFGPAINFAQYYSKLVSPGVFTPQSMVGSFWALGFGNPALNTGDDNGSFADENWIVPYSGNQAVFGYWSQSNGIDGCIDGKIAPGKTGEIMVAGFSDYRAQQNSYFAVAAVARHATDWIQFDFSAIGRDITLAVLPKPVIDSSARVGPRSLQIGVRAPTASQLAQGFYSDGSVDLPEVIVGYRVYSQAWTFGTPLPDVQREGWTPLTGTVPIGELATVILDCTRHYEFLAVSLVFEGGFEGPYLSAKSTTISCEMCIHDADGDGRAGDVDCGQVDCDDADSQTYPGANEINDGKDNQCPGDPGFGLVDEVDGMGGFATLGDENALSWPPQAGATAYQVARSSDPTLAANCTSFLTNTPSITDPDTPSANVAFYYLIRSTAPHMGSWGKTSAGVQRSTGCP